jgi:hypothetical protein
MGFWRELKQGFRQGYRQAHNEAYNNAIPLCAGCRAMTLTPSTEPQLLREHANNQALYDSAQECMLCLFVIQRNVAQNRVQFVAEDNLASQANVNASIKIFQVYENGQYNLKWEADSSLTFDGGAYMPGLYCETFGGLVVDEG